MEMCKEAIIPVARARRGVVSRLADGMIENLPLVTREDESSQVGKTLLGVISWRVRTWANLMTTSVVLWVEL